MTIEQKLLSFKESIPKVSDYMEDRILNRIGNPLATKVKMPKFKLRYASLFVVFIAILSIGVVLLLNNTGTTSGGLSVGYTVGGGAPELFPGYVGLKMEKTEYELSTPVPVIFNYGHFYYGNQEEEIYDHTITVYVANGHKYIADIEQNIIGYPQYYFQQYQLFFEGTDFIQEQYEILNSRPLAWGSTIQYPKEFVLNINFNDIPLDKGLITIEISRTATTGNITAPLLSTELKTETLFFLKEGESIRFDWRQMPYWGDID